MTVHVALYGDVNLNIIDGSAIWLVSVAEVLDRIDDVRCTLLLKAPIERDVVSGPLRDLSSVTVVEPDGVLRDPAHAAARLEQIDTKDRFDALILRGMRVCTDAARVEALRGRVWAYLTDIPQRLHELDEERRAMLEEIADASHLLLCQTPQLRSYLEAALGLKSVRSELLPPMVPTAFFPTQPPPVRVHADGHAGPLRLLYAGKFAPGWGFLETVAALQHVRAQGMNVELHVAGDKVHNPFEDPAFAPAVRDALDGTPGLIWHGAVARLNLPELIRSVDVALSPRSAWLDDSLELSTKILEYGAAGVPVVLNRNEMHVTLLGAEYPLFLDRLADLRELLARLVTDGESRARAALLLHAAAQRFSLDAVAERLQPHLHRLRRASPAGRPTRLVVAGHDLKFVRPLLPWLERAGCEIRVDEWRGHTRHDAHESRSLAKWADVVLCEWCLGNAVWYSHHKRDGQRLVIRLHQQELSTAHPESLDVEAVDRVVTVSTWMQQRVGREAARLAHLVEVVPNAIDTLALDRPKLPESSLTLGILGVLPWLKRPDIAVDLLETLLTQDPRYRLVVGGPLPWELTWLWERPDERQRYEALLRRISASSQLSTRVSFDGRVGNVPAWFQKVGVILSPSDAEAFHLAVAEGMASGAVPAIANRPGAAAIFGSEWIHDGVSDTAVALLDLRASDRFEQVGREAQRQARERFALDHVAPRFVAHVLGDREPHVAIGTQTGPRHGAE